MNLEQLKSLFLHAGAKRLYAKPLAENDNSKNQVYFGPGFQALNLFPNEGVLSSADTKIKTYKAKLPFSWLKEDGSLVGAPGAQLILYPQYPEVRFSGFLKGCASAPSSLMAGRSSGRILFLGVTDTRQIVGFVVGADSEVAAEFLKLGLSATSGVFIELHLPTVPDKSEARSRLIAELGRIHRLGWIESKQLDSKGRTKPCNAPQCGGFTLEAELGIPKNSNVDPDFLGWEIKQHTVTNFNRLDLSKAITIMTPEPTGGFYKKEGVEAFIRRFGYADKLGRTNRMNFGGIYRNNQLHPTTNLSLVINGYDASKCKITDVNGSIALVGNSGIVAAEWGFAGLLAHWSRKHMRAVYVPSMCQTEPDRRYRYGNKVRLAQGTDSLRLLNAFMSCKVYYDPGIKLECISGTARIKRRSQFRTASRDISSLYEKVEIVEV